MTEDSSTNPNPLPEESGEQAGDGFPQNTQPVRSAKPGPRWAEIWESLLRMGLGETALRIGTGVVSIALILLVVWVMGSFYF
jgi:hypothetical protein